MIRTAVFRRFLKLAPAAGLLWLGATAVVAAPANDDLANATDVNALLGGTQAGTVDFAVNPAGATLEPGEDPVGFDPVTSGPYQGSLWYRVRAPFGGTIDMKFISTLYETPNTGTILPPDYFGFLPEFDIYRIALGQPATIPLPEAITTGTCQTYTERAGYGVRRTVAFTDISVPADEDHDYLIRMQVPPLDLDGAFSITVRPDAGMPVLTVDSAIPTSGSVAAEATVFSFSGRAIDYNAPPGYAVTGVSGVECRFDGGSKFVATLGQETTDADGSKAARWSASVSPAPGSHVFQARAIDRSGLVSAWQTVTFARAFEAGIRDAQSFGVDDAPGTGWIAGTYYVDHGTLEYGGVDFGSRKHGFALNSRGWPINIVYDLEAGGVTALLSLPGR